MLSSAFSETWFYLILQFWNYPIATVSNELAILFHNESRTYEKDQTAPIWEVKALWSQENTCGRGNEARGWVLDGLKEPFWVSPGNVIHFPHQNVNVTQGGTSSCSMLYAQHLEQSEVLNT